MSPRPPIYAVFLPHGGYVHGTTEAPAGPGTSDPSCPRTRKTLCGLMGYRDGPGLLKHTPAILICGNCLRGFL